MSLILGPDFLHPYVMYTRLEQTSEWSAVWASWGVKDKEGWCEEICSQRYVDPKTDSIVNATFLIHMSRI